MTMPTHDRTGDPLTRHPPAPVDVAAEKRRIRLILGLECATCGARIPRDRTVCPAGCHPDNDGQE